MKHFYLFITSITILLFGFQFESKAVTCSTDTLHYALNKSSAFRAITLGASSATSVAQYYRAPQPISVSGFEFYAYASGTPTITLTCEIYLAAADSSPSGAPLRSSTITIDSSTSAIYNTVLFTTPVTVSSNYVLVVTNPSTTFNAAIVCNDYIAGDGFGEYFALGRILGTWLRGDDIVVGTTPFNADWIIEPFVVYSNTDSIYTFTTTVCAGSPITLNGFTSAIVTDDMYNVNQFIGATATNTFGWTFGDTTITPTNLQTVSHTYYTPGTYTVTLYDTIRRWRAAKCIGSTTITITVLPSVLTSSYTNSSGALNVSFTNTSTTGVNYFWRFGDGGTSTSINPSHAYSLPGRYQVCLLSYNACDSTTWCDSITVTCPPPPVPGLITGPTTYCPSDVDTFSIAPVSGATSYTWYGTGWTGSSSTTTVILTAGATAGNVYVTANSICGASAPDSLVISFGLPPAAPGIISGPSTYCPGDVDTFTITSVPRANSYTWSFTNWTGSSTSNSIILTAGVSASNISVLANNTCGSSTATIKTISIGSAPPTPGTISGSSTYCDSLVYTYSVTPVVGATSYAWSCPGWIGTSSTNSITLTATISSGTISVRSVNACGTSAASTLSVSPSAGPPTPGTISGSGTVVCPGATINLSVAPVVGATSYIWILPSGWTGSSATNNISITVGATGGTVGVAAQNTCGTSSNSTFTYSIGSIPDTAIAIMGSTTLCANITATYSIAPVVGATSYTWVLPSGWAGTSTTNSISVTTGTSSGTISVATVNACGSSASISTFVTITSLSASISITPQSSISANGTISISTPTGGVGPYQYALDAGPFQPGSFFNGVESDTHRVIIRDLNGCTQIYVIFVPSTVGINASENIEAIELYPNPVSTILHLHLNMESKSNLDVILRDMLGNIVWTKQLTDINILEEKIDVSSIAKGNYVLQLVNENLIISRRIIVQ